MSRIVATGLAFPEGPVAMPDGSVILVEIRAGNLTRVLPGGAKEVIAHVGGGPNGAAIGPDGHAYICNNGGFKWYDRDGMMLPGHQADDYAGGRIERVNLATGQVERLYDAVDGRRLRGPNDIVFDAHGGFWFTDLGKGRNADLDRGGIFYGRVDGSLVKQVAWPLLTPNGIGLSPDGRTLYAAETESCRVYAWNILAPGEVDTTPADAPKGGRMIYASPTFARFDSLAVEADGNVCVATLHQSGITVVSPVGGRVEFVPVAPGRDWMVTNICFGGADMKTAWVTCSGTGTLVEMAWARPGLKLLQQR